MKSPVLTYDSLKTRMRYKILMIIARLIGTKVKVQDVYNGLT